MRECFIAGFVFYGRDVGYVVERIVLDDKIEAISATQLRQLGTER